jgi:O-antigen ligase
MHALAAGALFLLAGVSAWRPAAGLLVAAAIVPVASWAGRGWAAHGLVWVTVVTIACLAGILAASAIGRTSRSRDPWLRAAALSMGMVVAASAAVQLAPLHERLGGAAFREQVRQLVTEADLVYASRTVPAVTAAALLLQGLALFYAAARCAGSSAFFTRQLSAAVVAGASAAAAVNIWRVLQAFARSGWSLANVADLLGTTRINEHYGDMNAAGSYFVLALWIALASIRHSRTAMLAALTIAGALWMTGSRAALLAGVVASAVPLVSAGPWIRARRRLIVAAGCAALVAAAAALAWIAPQRGNQQGVGAAVMVRLELTRTAMNMVASRPVFGIGAGQFYQRSGEFSSPALLALFPPARNENAHNNFLQILAEVGVIGFAAFLWLLALAARRTAASMRNGGGTPAGLAAGVVAFLITCLAGHPLLTPEVSATFWLALGALSGMPRQAAAAGSLGEVSSAAMPDRPASRPWRPAATGPIRVAAALAIVLAATLPLRARREVAETNLDHVGIGLSPWHRTEDDRLYRILSGRSATVFVPSDARGVSLPLRSTSGIREVELRLDGRPANVVDVASDRWSNIRIVLPAESSERKYRRVDLSVRGDVADDEDVLLVGKVVPDE